MTTDERITIQDGSIPTLNAVVGAIALGIGALVSLAPIFSKDPAGLLGSLPLLVFLGFPFAAVGALLLFRRTGMWLDLKAKTLVTWSKFLWYPKKVTVTALTDFVDILVTEKTVRSSKRTRVYQSVFLRSVAQLSDIQEAVMKPSKATQETVELYRYQALQEAREMAKTLSSTLSLPVSEDKNSPTVSVNEGESSLTVSVTEDE